MGLEEKLLATLLECDAFQDEASKVSGVAKLAVDKGFDKLSAAQRKLLEPFMARRCDGIKDPGGYHNGCKAVLTGKELLDGWALNFAHGGVICESCQEEASLYQHQLDKIMAE